MKWYLYVLRSPLSGRTRYVGITKHPAARLRSHLAKSSPAPRDRWIAALRNRNVKPSMVVKCIVGDIAEAKALEIAYIARLRIAGVKLVNATPGGDAPHTAWTAKKIANGQRRVWATPERRTAHARLHVGATRSLEARANIGASKRGSKWTPEQRARHRDRVRETWTPERRASYSANRKGKPQPRRVRREAQGWVDAGTTRCARRAGARISQDAHVEQPSNENRGVSAMSKSHAAQPMAPLAQQPQPAPAPTTPAAHAYRRPHEGRPMAQLLDAGRGEQPRVPAGSPQGGQWAPSDGSSSRQPSEYWRQQGNGSDISTRVFPRIPGSNVLHRVKNRIKEKVRDVRDSIEDFQERTTRPSAREYDEARFIQSGGVLDRKDVAPKSTGVPPRKDSGDDPAIIERMRKADAERAVYEQDISKRAAKYEADRKAAMAIPAKGVVRKVKRFFDTIADAGVESARRGYHQ